MANAQAPMGNPAVVGLAGFGLTTLILQLHNLGLCGLGPVIACGIIFGGLAQLMAGLQEFKVGNNFGYSAFVSYGAFWIALCIMLLFNKFDIYKSSGTDIGYFLVVWTLYTAIMWIGAMRIHGAMASTFTLLLAGFILLDLAHFGYPAMTKVAAMESGTNQAFLLTTGRLPVCCSASRAMRLILNSRWSGALSSLLWE